MGKLYDYCGRIQEHIERNGLDVFRTRGELALEVGFLITLVDENDPDDPDKIRSLQTAAQKLLGLSLD